MGMPVTTIHYMASNRAPAKPWYEEVVATIAVRGWTKAELSDRSGVARTTIDNWERNLRRPQAKSVNSVADALGIPRERALRLAGVISEAAEADRSPPRELPDDLKEHMREVVGDEMASALIAAYEQLLRGRGRPTGGAASRPPESGGKDQRTAG